VSSESHNSGGGKSRKRSDHGYVNLGSGWRRPAQEFDLYGEAFHKAAKQLTQALADDDLYEPLDVCPIVFLYRHATELYLKGILRAGESLLNLEGMQLRIDDSSLRNHPLRPLLKPLRQLFEAMDWAQSYAEIASFVVPLDEIDSNSFTFRYPVDKQNVGALPDSFAFDILAFARAADSCLDVLYNASCTVEHYLEDAQCMLSESCW